MASEVHIPLFRSTPGVRKLALYSPPKCDNTNTTPSLAARRAAKMIVSLKPQKPNNPEAGRLKSTRPGVSVQARAGGGEGRPRGSWPRAPGGPGARGGGGAAGAGATSHFPGPGRRERGERRAARLAGRPLAPPAARRGPPHSPPTGGCAHCTLPAATARRPAPARRRAERRGPRRRPHSAGASDTQPRSGGPARRRARRARAAWPGPVKGTSCKQFRK